MNRNSYTDKTVAKWPHGRDDMVFNRQFWLALLAYLAIVAGASLAAYLRAAS